MISDQAMKETEKALEARKATTKDIREMLMSAFGLSKSQANDIIKTVRKRMGIEGRRY